MLKKFWYWRVRQLDIKILWPTMKLQASSIAEAKEAFAIHCWHDEAWRSLGAGEMERRIFDLQ